MENVWSWRPPSSPAANDVRRLSWLAAGLLHVVALAILASIGMPVSPGADRPPVRAARPAPAAPRIVFLPSEGLGGGGGGGGNGQADPIRRAQGPGHDRVTLHVKPRTTPTQIADQPPPIGHVVLDAVPLGSGGIAILGLPEGGVPSGTSLGPGSGGGVGTGSGTGIGPGLGAGLGPGSGGGAGGGVYRVGGSVTSPRVIEQVRPAYSEAALADRVQGSVQLDVVVTRLGRAGAIRVVRSLDAGLDEEAIRAVRQWRFEPGRLAGEPVDVLVTIVLDFRIH